jgi:splicing factor 3B subunit 5
VTHQHRDTLASIVGHPTLTSYLAIADGESLGRIKFEMTEVFYLFIYFHWKPADTFFSLLQKMLQPCGPPPRKDDD